VAAKPKPYQAMRIAPVVCAVLAAQEEVETEYPFWLKEEAE
jgi:hypothetical protein